MKSITRHPLGEKIIFSFIVASLISGLIGYSGIAGLRQIKELDRSWHENAVKPLGNIAVAAMVFQRSRLHMKNVFFGKDVSGEEVDQNLKTIIELDKTFHDELKQFGEYITDEEERKGLRLLQKEVTLYEAVRDRIINLVKNGQKAESLNLMSGENIARAKAVDDYLKKLIESATRQEKNKWEENSVAIADAIKSTSVLVGIGIMVVMLVGLFMLRSIIRPIKAIGNIIDRVARGETEVILETVRNDEIGLLFTSLGNMIGKIKALAADAGMLAQSIMEGKLTVRADAEKHEGDYRKIIEGANHSLEAVIGPLNMAADYVGRIGRGDIPPKISESMNGDFNIIKNNLNACIDGLDGLTEANFIMQRLVVNDLTKKVEGNYAGVFSTLAGATNNVRDRLLSITKVFNLIASGDTSCLEDLKKIGQRSEEDISLPA
ncbi:MAG: MCP four helix bundle domain-containing protein, partial [Deltaproteobacteria bacterium]|nr:MCP four helix bundle domain-containing protein [Deltaproteobacteria bacterium]